MIVGTIVAGAASAFCMFHGYLNRKSSELCGGSISYVAAAIFFVGMVMTLK